jgi:predicted Zn-dependent protease
MTVATLAGILAAVFVGMQGGSAQSSQAISAGAIAGARSIELKYSRENEEEADQLGLQYLTAAGYDPEHMVAAMQKLSQGAMFSRARIPTYLSTHPHIIERVQYLETLVAKQDQGKPRSERKPMADDFPLVLAALIGECEDQQKAMDRFRSATGLDRLAASFGMGRLLVRQGQVDRALPLLQEVSAQRPNSPLVLSTLGEAYFKKGRLIEAQRALQSALLLDPRRYAVRYRLALVLQDQGQTAKALGQLQDISQFAPNFPEIDHQLGVVYGQLNQLGEAHVHLGRYYKSKLDWDTALFHYQKAKVLLTSSKVAHFDVDRDIEKIKKKKRDAIWKSPGRF